MRTELNLKLDELEASDNDYDWKLSLEELEELNYLLKNICALEDTE